MKEYKIEVVIDDNGVIRSETFGIEGEDCVNELTELLNDIVEFEEVQKKPEYYFNSAIKTKIGVRKK